MTHTPAAHLRGTNRHTILRVYGSSIASTAATGLVGIVLLPFILHRLSADAYGEWATLSGLITIGLLVEAGIGTELARRVASAQGLDDTAGIDEAVAEGTATLTAIAYLLECIALTTARPVVNTVFSTVSAGERGQLLILYCGTVSVFALQLAAGGYFATLQGLQRADYINWAMTFSLLASGITTVIALLAGLGLWALFLSVVVQFIVSTSIQGIGLHRVAPSVRFIIRLPRPSSITTYVGKPTMLLLGSASIVFDTQIDKLVLTHHSGPSASAYFQIGATLSTSARAVSLIPLGVLLAGTAELYRTNPARLDTLDRYASSTAQSIAAVTAGGCVIFAHSFMRLWLGNDFDKAALSLELLAVASFFNIWSAPWYFYATGRGRYDYVLKTSGISIVINFTCTVLLTSTWGLDGALLGSILGNLGSTIFAWFLVRRWERRQWLAPALRASIAVAIITVPYSLLWHTGTSWGSLVLGFCMYITLVSISLLACRAVPVALTRSRKGLRVSLR